MISVILGTYNRLDKLKLSINSILNSTGLSEPPEIIVIDAGSTDGTVEYLKSIPGLVYINENGLHGVTRGYNRGFRLASRKYITWISDDVECHDDCLSNLVKRLESERWDTVIAVYYDDQDGNGYVSDTRTPPIAGLSKKLMKSINYWSDEYLTYGSDTEMSLKVYLMGGTVKGEKKCKMIHHIDRNDFLHKENTKNLKCNIRYSKLYNKAGGRDFKQYPEIFVSSSSLEELIRKVEGLRLNMGWANFFSDKDYGKKDLLNGMNIQICNKNEIKTFKHRM